MSDTNSKPLRTKQVSIKLTEEQYAALEKSAQKHFSVPGVWARRALLKALEKDLGRRLRGIVLTRAVRDRTPSPPSEQGGA